MTILKEIAVHRALQMIQLYQIRVHIIDWHCEGLHGGSTARNCQMATPVNGVCDNMSKE